MCPRSESPPAYSQEQDTSKKKSLLAHDQLAIDCPEDDSEVETNVLGFPPMIEVPGVREIVLFLVLGVFFAFSLTIFKQSWEDAGVSSEDLIKFGSIPLISIGCIYTSSGLHKLTAAPDSPTATSGSRSGLHSIR